MKHLASWITPHLIPLAVITVLCLFSLPAFAASKQGVVMARTVILNDQGQPTLVELGDDGFERGEVSLGSWADKANELRIVAAADYHQQLLRLHTFQQQHAGGLAAGAELLNSEQFLNRSWQTADNQPIDAPTLNSNIASVLVRAQRWRITEVPDALILLNFTLDLSQNITVNPTTRSLVVTPAGQIIAQSDYSIAPRSGFFGDPNQPQTPFGGNRRQFDDPIHGPLANVRVSVNDHYPGGVGTTDDSGRYRLEYRLPLCPGFVFTYTTYVTAELRYRNFSPIGHKSLPFYLRRTAYDVCNGLLGGGIGLASYANLTDFWVDVMVLNGHLCLENELNGDSECNKPITLSDQTRYTVTTDSTDPLTPTPTSTPTPFSYDFDADGETDSVKYGVLQTETDPDGQPIERFVVVDTANMATHQGVYLSSRTDDSGEPDLLREIDTVRPQGNIGLLSSISVDDLQNTDLLLFREASGQLIMERRGLRDAEIDGRKQIGTSRKPNQLFYRFVLRGPRDSNQNIGAINRRGSWTEWATRNQLTEPFQRQEANHLKPGEWVRLVGINRATGYTGSVRFQLQGANATDNQLDFKIQPLVLRPPNLRVWAERVTEIEAGITAGEQHTYLIGGEGAARSQDAMIQIFTEWLDHDGSPLPEELGLDNGEQYGLTGRLAKIVSPNQLGGVAPGQLANFPIAPGRQIQVLKVRDNSTWPEHFYIHVSGTAKDNNPDFASTGKDGVPEGRPDGFTPFLVPLFDEETHWEQQKTYHDLRNQQVDVGKPAPAYAWAYRPEYQFSRFSLEIDELNRTEVDDQGQETHTDLYPSQTPMISSSDDWLTAFYSLVAPEFDRLSPIEGPQQLVFALGEHEVPVELGADRTIRFTNIEHLALLDASDLLTMRLYVNQDAGNVLWEYAFEHIAIFPPLSKDAPVIELSADDAGSVSYSAVHLSKQTEPTTIKWGYTTNPSTESVSFDPQTHVSTRGVHHTLARLPVKAGTLVRVYAARADDTNNKFHSITYEIVPGEPKLITYQLAGETAISGIGEATLTIQIYDEFGNPVRDGTSVGVDTKDLTVDGDLITANGEVTVKIKGGFTPGVQDILITAGAINQAVALQVHDINLSVAMNNTIEIGDTVPVTITATSSYSHLDEIVIDVSAIRASIDSKRYALDASGIATFNAYVGTFTGEGRIFASIAEKIERHDFTVVDSSDVQLLDNVIVSGVNGKGSVTVNNATYEYTNQTGVVVNGNSGDVVTASLVDYLEPPMLPELRFPMQRDPEAGQIKDTMIGYLANIINVDRVTNNFDAWQYAFELGSDSTITIDHDPLKTIVNPGFVLNFKPSQEGQVIQWQGLGLTLEYKSSQELVLSRTDGNTTIMAVAPLLAANTWHRIGAHFVQGHLILQVGETIYKSNGVLAAQPALAGSLQLGSGAEGLVSDFAIYDWDATKLATFENGMLEQSMTLDASGKGVFKLRAPVANVFASVDQRRFDYWKNQHNGLLETAFAAGDDCTPVNPAAVDSFGELVHLGAEYSRFVADCNYLPKLKRAFIEIKTATGVVNKSIAVAELTYYASHYISAKQAELALVLGPQCIHGAVTGDVDNFTSGTCDIITSFFLVGDVRDFILHSKYQYWDRDNSKFDYPTYVFSGLGMAASLASLGTVGIPANVAIAGMKTGAKTMKGASFPTAMADFLMKQIDSDFWNFQKLKSTLNVSLPILQVSAAVVLYKDEFAEAYQAISSIKPEQIAGVMKYCKLALTQLEADLVVLDQSDFESELRWLSIAYAIDKDGLIKLLGGSEEAGKAIKNLLEAMQNAQSRAGDKLGTSSKGYIYELFNEGISNLGNNKISNEDLLKIIANDKFLTAMIIAQNIGEVGSKNSASMVDALRRFHCLPGAHPKECFMGGISTGKDGLIQFFGLFEKLADAKLAGKIDDEAWRSIGKVITAMGNATSGTDKSAATAFGAAKGATSNFVEMVLQLQGSNAKLIKVEEKIETVVGNNTVGNHVFDHVMVINGVTKRREVKEWEPESISKHLWDYFKGAGTNKHGEDVAPGQLFLDMVDLLHKGAHNDLSKVDIEWVFVKGNPDVIVSELIDKINKDSSKLKQIIINSGDSDLLALLDEGRGNDLVEFVNDDLQRVLSLMIVNGKSI